MGYLDPNIFGILSQVGLAILLVFGVVFTFFRTAIKRMFGVFKKDRAETEPVEDKPSND